MKALSKGYLNRPANAPYTDPILYEEGFFHTFADEQKMMDKADQMRQALIKKKEQAKKKK